MTKRKIDGISGIEGEGQVDPAKRWEAAFETFYALTPESVELLNKNKEGAFRNISGDELHVTMFTRDQIAKDNSLHKEINRLITAGFLGGVEFDRDGKVRNVHFREDIAKKLGNSQTFMIDNDTRTSDRQVPVQAQVLGISHEAYKISALALAALLGGAVQGPEKMLEARNEKNPTAHPTTVIDVKKADTAQPEAVQSKTVHSPAAKKPRIEVPIKHTSHTEERRREQKEKEQKAKAREVREEAKQEEIEHKEIDSQRIKDEEIQNSLNKDPSDKQPKHFRQLGT